MQTYIDMEPAVEKVDTGAIVVIAGEYIPMDRANHELPTEPIFLVTGETAPYFDDNSPSWKLTEAFDFAS